MKTSTAFNHFTRLKSRLESVFGAARCYKPTHAHLLESVSAVYADKALAKCPSWVRTRLFDYAQSQFDFIAFNLTVWLHVKADGTACGWDEYAASIPNDDNRAAALSNGESHLYWLHETTGCGTIADTNVYRTGSTIARTFLVTDKVF